MRTATLALLTCLAVLSAGADWLVMRDGARIETEGAWTQRGRLVVFTTAAGQLSSLRTESIDLEASRRATAAAADAAAGLAVAEPAPDAMAPRRESRRITNADIPAGRPTPAGAAAANADGEALAATPAAASDLQVRATAQQIDPINGHLVVTGTLVNGSQRTAAAVELIVQAFGADGELLATQSAALDLAALRPGGTTSFEADFPDVYGGAMALRFAPSASFLETQQQDDPRMSRGEAEDGFERFEDGP